MDGTPFGRYRLVDLLGRGGMGTIYEAVHTGIGKHVALKFLEGQIDQDAQTRARFLREAQTASMVESPHVVHIFDSGLSDDGATRRGSASARSVCIYAGAGNT